MGFNIGKDKKKWSSCIFNVRIFIDADKIGT